MSCGLTIETYNNQRLAVRGDRERYQELMKTVSGRWNPRMHGGEGWLVPIANKEQLIFLIDSLEEESEEADDLEEIVSHIKSRKEQKKYHREQSEDERSDSEDSEDSEEQSEDKEDSEDSEEQSEDKEESSDDEFIDPAITTLLDKQVSATPAAAPVIITGAANEARELERARKANEELERSRKANEEADHKFRQQAEEEEKRLAKQRRRAEKLR